LRPINRLCIASVVPHQLVLGRDIALAYMNHAEAIYHLSNPNSNRWYTPAQKLCDLSRSYQIQTKSCNTYGATCSKSSPARSSRASLLVQRRCLIPGLYAKTRSRRRLHTTPEMDCQLVSDMQEVSDLQEVSDI
jgi:hypothetical protein